MSKKEIIESGKKIIEIECENLNRVKENLGESFAEAVEEFKNCKGKVKISWIRRGRK